MNSSRPWASQPARRTNLGSHAIRFAFVVATELQHVAACQHLRASLSRPGAPIVAQDGAEQAQQTIRDEALGQLIRGVPSRNVRHFVREDAGELRLVGRGLQGAPVDPYRTAGQREGVDLFVVRNREAIRIAGTAGTGRDATSDRCHVRNHPTIGHYGQVFSHPLLRLATDRDLLLNRDQSVSGEGHRQESQPEDRRGAPHTRGAGAAGISSGLRRRSRALAAVTSTPYSRTTAEM